MGESKEKKMIDVGVLIVFMLINCTIFVEKSRSRTG